MLGAKTVQFSLNVINVRSGFDAGYFKEFDRVIFRITLLNRETPIDLSDKTIKLFAKKPNNSIVYQETDIEVVNARGGLIDVYLKSGLLNAIGKVVCELEIVNSDSTFITSGEFSYTVIDKLNNLDNEIEEVEDIEFLNQAREFTDYIVPEEIKRVEAESARNSNEVKRIYNEQLRTLDEEARKINEVDRQNRIMVIENKVDTVVTTSEIDGIIQTALQ